MKNSEYISTKEASELLSLSEVTIKRYLKSGKLKSIKIYGNRLIKLNELESLNRNNINKKKATNNIPKNLHFYWSKKSIDSASDIIDLNCKDGDIVFDPFLGSGSTLFGTLFKNLKFIGVELNEMPFRIPKFYLEKSLDKRTVKMINNYEKIKTELVDHYMFFYKKKKYYFKKCIFDRVDNKVIIKEIYFQEKNGKIKNFAGNHPFEDFYKKQISSFSKKISKKNNLKLIKNSRIAIKDNMYLSDIFSSINFFILLEIKKKIKNDNDLKFLLSSSLHLLRLTDKRSQSQFPYWVPKNNILDRNIFDTLDKKITALIKIKDFSFDIDLLKNFKDVKNAKKSSALLINKPIQKIQNEIPKNSIDFVITDPPYFDQIAYSEYLKIWEFFTDYDSNLKDEIIVSNREDFKSDLDQYFTQMKLAFNVVFSKMKNESKLVIYFKDNNISQLFNFIKMLKEIGFEYIKQEYISSNNFTYKQNVSRKNSLVGDCIFIFKKQSKNNKNKKNISPSNIDLDTIVLNFAKSHLYFNGKSNVSEILFGGLIDELFVNEVNHIEDIGVITKILESEFNYNNKTRKYSLKKQQQQDDQTVLFGDSIQLLQNIPTDSVDHCITDPPYNISGYDNKKNIGWLKSNETWTDKKFNKINEEWDKHSDHDYVLFSKQWIKEIRRIVKPNGNIAIFGSYHNIYRMGTILEDTDTKINNSIVWYKRNAFPNITQRMFCESTEHIIWAVNNSKKDAKNWTFNYNELKKINNNKQMRNMFDIPMTKTSEKKFGKYPAQKPILLIEYLVKGLTNKNEIIIDPFLGSGTTAVVSKSLNRHCIGIDNNLEAIKIAKKRLADINSKQLDLFDDT